jgi:hypothetical protein
LAIRIHCTTERASAIEAWKQDDLAASQARAHGCLRSARPGYGGGMITIKIKNVAEIVERQKGWFIANVVGSVVDLGPRVEAVVIEKLKQSFAEQGIVADIERNDG